MGRLTYITNSKRPADRLDISVSLSQNWQL
jgi:hypothetical protein